MAVFAGPMKEGLLVLWLRPGFGIGCQFRTVGLIFQARPNRPFAKPNRSSVDDPVEHSFTFC